jgi:hypothetical protein
VTPRREDRERSFFPSLSECATRTWSWKEQKKLEEWWNGDTQKRIDRARRTRSGRKGGGSSGVGVVERRGGSGDLEKPSGGGGGGGDVRWRPRSGAIDGMGVSGGLGRFLGGVEMVRGEWPQ